MAKKCNIKKVEIIDDIRFKDTSEKTLQKIKKFIHNDDIKVKAVDESKPFLKLTVLQCGKRVNLGDYILKDSEGLFYVSSGEAYKKYQKKHGKKGEK